MEAFVYVIHYGSFNKAADALFLSQPSVTARIQTLERELDCKLFDRIGKHVQLTEEGKRFLPYAQQLLQTFQKGKQHVQQKKKLPDELRIGCTVSVANYMLPLLLPRMKRKYPHIHFKLQTGTTDDLVNRVLNKEIDIGFVRNVNHPNLKSVKLIEDPIRLHVYEGHPFIGDENLTIGAIGREPLVFFECGALDWLRVHRIFESLDQPPLLEIQTDNSETAKKLVLQKVGICFLPGMCTRTEVAEGKLYPIEFPETAGISMQTHIIALQGEHDEFLRTLSEFGRELLNKP
jgi:DNA-binding transcriptional LysR family regulator